jgi:membrane protease YdiL (CAAX protease family)
MISVVVAPLIETFLMQYAIMEFIIYSIKKRNITTDLLALLTSAAIFGAAHNYNPLTIVHAFLFGLIFGSIYLYQKEKGNNPFFFTFLLHALSNLIAFIIDDVMHWV